MKKIIRIFSLIIILGFGMAFFDIFQIARGELPVFNIQKYDNTTNIQTFRGLFYSATRKITASQLEPLNESSNVKLTILFLNLIKKNELKKQNKYEINVTELTNCQEKAKLYYADKDIKVYTFCLKDIKVEKNKKGYPLNEIIKKDKGFITNIDLYLTYTSLAKDGTTQVFKNLDMKNDLTVYKCNKENINDIYFAPKNTVFQSDFCTYKDDDFKFIYEIKEENQEPSNEEEVKEVLFEDEKYRYEITKKKSVQFYVSTPAVRGKKETKYLLKDLIANQTITLEEAKEHGVKFVRIDKEKEQKDSLTNNKINNS